LFYIRQTAKLQKMSSAAHLIFLRFANIYENIHREI